MFQSIARKPTVAKVVALATRIAADPEDSPDLRLQKTLMVSGSTMIVFAALLWSSIYFSYGEYLAGSIPFSYSVISSASIIFYAARRGFRFYRFSQLLLILLLPFLLMIALGGFVNSSAVVLWSLLSPLGALMFGEPRRAPRWFLAYVFLVVLSGFMQPFARSTNSLPTAVVTFFFVMNIVTISAIAFVLLYYFVHQKDATMRLLQTEQERSERLLLNILPAEVAAILKVENRLIAESYQSATVLFADLVDFTPMTAELEPSMMVELLNDVFSQFDALAEKYGVEKIRTIGDNYMVASGVPSPREDHAEAIAYMALEMCSCLEQYRTGMGDPLHFRIGINTGPLVAGVVGQRKFQYDIWGDTVNVASRMESQGLPDRIQVTSATREEIKGKFHMERRGFLEVKGKGMMETWFLNGTRGGKMVNG